MWRVMGVGLGVAIILISDTFFWWEAIGCLIIITCLIIPKQKKTFTKVK